MYVCMYVMCMCMCAYVCMCTYVCAHVYVYMLCYACIYVRVYICLFIYMLFLYGWIGTYACIATYIFHVIVNQNIISIAFVKRVTQTDTHGHAYVCCNRFCEAISSRRTHTDMPMYAAIAFVKRSHLGGHIRTCLCMLQSLLL